jgi:hypothetical protein
VNNEGCYSWEELETTYLHGLTKALKLKAAHGNKDIALLVKAVGYYEAIIEVERFHAIVDAAARVAFPRRFAETVVVDYGEGFIWRR